jgi:hypothetical protein
VGLRTRRRWRRSRIRDHRDEFDTGGHAAILTSTAQTSTAQTSTAQTSTAQTSTAQTSTAQTSTARVCAFDQ